MIEWCIDIPNLQTIDLPDSFEEVQSKSITSICMNNNKWIDVSPILADLVKISIIDRIDDCLKQYSINSISHLITSIWNEYWYQYWFW